MKSEGQEREREKVNSSRYFFNRNIFRFTVFFLIISGSFLVFGVKTAQAKSCGGAVACACGDTVTSSYVLTSDLTCTGNGLGIGASGITIDGKDAGTGINHTITGNASVSTSGIYDYGNHNNVTIKNLTTTNFAFGIYVYNVTGLTIQNITANLNNDTGLYVSSTTGATLTGNTVINNVGGTGIILDSSTGDTLTGNTMSGNTNSNLSVTVTSISNYNNTIDTTNTVEGKKVYYLYNQSNQTYDDATGTYDIGMFLCVSCTNITIKNATLSAHNDNGVYFYNTTGSTIQNVTANSNYNSGIYVASSTGDNITGNTTSSNNIAAGLSGVSGIYLSSSTGDNITGNTTSSNNTSGIDLESSNSNTITGNTIDSNNNYGIDINSSNSNTITGNTVNLNSTAGIYLSSSTGDNITGNTINSNNSYGIDLSSSSSNTITGNAMSKDLNDLYNTGTTNTYSSNQFLHNITSKMLTFVDGTRTGSVGVPINFDFSMFDAGGAACTSCAYTVTTSPSETVSSSQVGNEVTGSFTPTQSGTYSLMFTATDPESNVTQRNLSYLVGATASQTTEFYYRTGKPVHGQPYGIGRDSKRLLLTTPTGTETWYCSSWVQNSPDELPTYPLANITGINTYSWYMASTSGLIGIQRYLTYDETVDASSSISLETHYTWVNKNFTGLNWGMDYPSSWYWLSLKLDAVNPYQQTTVAQPSYANFTYSYPTTPAIKSISNTDVLVLSATAPVAATTSASIVLQNTASTTSADTVTLSNLKRPFTNAVSTIGSDGTTALAVSLAGYTTTTMAAVPMDITVSSGTVDFNISLWNTTGAQEKTWTENGSVPSATSTHTISGLTPNTAYAFTLDGTASTTALISSQCAGSTCTSDSSGNLSFTYQGGYSSHTFDFQIPSSLNTAVTRVMHLFKGFKLMGGLIIF